LAGKLKRKGFETTLATTFGAGLEAIYQRLSRLHRQLRACVEQRLASAPTEAA